MQSCMAPGGCKGGGVVGWWGGGLYMAIYQA